MLPAQLKFYGVTENDFMQKINAFINLPINPKKSHKTNNLKRCFLHQQVTHTLSIFAILLLTLIFLSSCVTKYTKETSNVLREKNSNLTAHTESRLDLS